MNTATDIAEAAAVLDQVAPGWFTAIDIDRLDIDDGQRCIAGQLSGSVHRDAIMAAAIDRAQFATDVEILQGWDRHYRKYSHLDYYGIEKAVVVLLGRPTGAFQSNFGTEQRLWMNEIQDRQLKAMKAVDRRADFMLVA